MREGRGREALRILGLCVLASVLFGVVFDLISCRICLEYFTVHHPPIFPTEDPILLGLAWGVFATWWMGALLGGVLAAACLLGPAPPLPARRLVRPVALGLGAVFAAAVLVWLLIYAIGTWGPMWADPSRKEPVPDLDRRLMSSALAHGFAYNASALFGLGLAIWCVRTRIREGRGGTAPRGPESPPG